MVLQKVYFLAIFSSAVRTNDILSVSSLINPFNSCEGNNCRDNLLFEILFSNLIYLCCYLLFTDMVIKFLSLNDWRFSLIICYLVLFFVSLTQDIQTCFSFTIYYNYNYFKYCCSYCYVFLLINEKDIMSSCTSCIIKELFSTLPVESPQLINFKHCNNLLFNSSPGLHIYPTFDL